VQLQMQPGSETQLQAVLLELIGEQLPYKAYGPDLPLRRRVTGQIRSQEVPLLPWGTHSSTPDRSNSQDHGQNNLYTPGSSIH